MIKMKINKNPYRPKIMLGIPTTGVIRYEWHAAIHGMTLPTNWSASSMTYFTASPVGYNVADARNTIVKAFLNTSNEWLFFIDHDVLCLPHTFIWLDVILRKPPSPVIGGLYYTKSYPAEPLVYRGRGNGAYKGFKLGSKVWVDGMGMGFTLLHRSILEHIWDNSPDVTLGAGNRARRVFETPRETWCDPETGLWRTRTGTEDLYFLSRVMSEGALKGQWEKLAKKRYPFLIDTNMFCWHIDLNGQRYPLNIDLPPGFKEWQSALTSKKWAEGLA